MNPADPKNNPITTAVDKIFTTARKGMFPEDNQSEKDSTSANNESTSTSNSESNPRPDITLEEITTEAGKVIESFTNILSFGFQLGIKCFNEAGKNLSSTYQKVQETEFGQNVKKNVSSTYQKVQETEFGQKVKESSIVKFVQENLNYLNLLKAVKSNNLETFNECLKNEISNDIRVYLKIDDLVKYYKLLYQPNIQCINPGEPLLKLTMALNRLEMTEALIVKGINLTSLDSKGQNALFWAIESGDTKSFKTLLMNENIDVNLKNSNQLTPLQFAINLDKDDFVCALLDHPNVDIMVKDEDENTIWHQVLEMQFPGKLVLNKTINKLFTKEYHSKIENIINHVNKDNNTLLNLAVVSGDEKAVTFLLAYKNNLTHKNIDGETVFHLAAYNSSDSNYNNFMKLIGRLSNFEILKATNNNKENILHIALKHNNDKVAEEILKKPSLNLVNVKDAQGNYPIHIIAKTGNQVVMNKILEQTENLSILNGNNKSAFYYSLKYNNIELYKKLIQKGEAIKLIKIDGKHPIEHAIDNNYNELIKLLLQQKHDTLGIDFNFNKAIQTSNDESVTYINLICRAINLNNNEALETLLNKNDIQAILYHKSTFYNCTPLELAIWVKNHVAMEMILKFDAKLAEVPFDNISPLHYSVKHKDVEACKILFKYGANLNSVNSQGDTLLSIAIQEHNLELVKMLHEGGANFMLADGNGLTPLSYAKFGLKQVKDSPELIEKAASILSIVERVNADIMMQEMEALKDAKAAEEARTQAEAKAAEDARAEAEAKAKAAEEARAEAEAKAKAAEAKAKAAKMAKAEAEARAKIEKEIYEKKQSELDNKEKTLLDKEAKLHQEAKKLEQCNEDLKAQNQTLQKMLEDLKVAASHDSVTEDHHTIPPHQPETVSDDIPNPGYES